VALKTLKPVTSSSRGVVLLKHEKPTVSKSKSKKLLKDIKKPFGRSRGKISVQHKGGGVKRKYRIIDFVRNLRDVQGQVTSVEYDPNRNVYVSLVSYSNGVKGYILTPNGIKVGDRIIASEDAPVEPGNALPLSKIPVGTEIHNIELNPGSGGVLVRSAGGTASILGFDKEYAQVRMPSKEVRLINVKCYATIGSLSNADYKNIVLGKAGRNRLKGKRPTVRGMVKSPVAHPHGGGEAKGVIGHIPRDMWGNIRGKKTRRGKHRYGHMILVTRKGRKVKSK